jgi:hypothetical protein
MMPSSHGDILELLHKPEEESFTGGPAQGQDAAES